MPPAMIETLLKIGGRDVPVVVTFKSGARRYILKVKSDGKAHVTIPLRGGSAEHALQFAEKHSAWLLDQLAKPPPAKIRRAAWAEGTEIFFRGTRVPIRLEAGMFILGAERFPYRAEAGPLEPQIQSRLFALAQGELTARTLELAAEQKLAVSRVTVRNQRSRWGSCSVRRTISLNWRLIQTPPFVRDYIILHELTHLRAMNHSSRFWQLVAEVCPSWREAESWIKKHGGEVLR